MKKRLLSALLALCMMLTMMPTVAFAAEDGDEGDTGAESGGSPVYTINPDTNVEIAGYNTLGAAIDAANTSEGPIIIEVRQNCMLDKAIAINPNKNVTITAQEGADVTITDDSRKGITLSTNSTLTVENLTFDTNGQIYLNGKGGDLTFSNVNLAMDGKMYQFNKDGYYCCAIAIEQPESSLTFDNCEVSIENYPSSGSAIRWNGSGIDTGYSISILNGTTLTSTNCYSGFVGTCDITIENSTVNVVEHRGNGSNGSYYKISNSKVNFTGNGSHGISAGGLTVSDNSNIGVQGVQTR